MFDTVKQSFDAGVKFLRPAVEQEQTAIGEQKAVEAFEKGEFEMRKPFSIRDRAYNASGERLVTNKAMIDLDEGFRSVMKSADGNMRKLEAGLQELKGKAGELPQIPGLQTRWLESYERGVATSRRQTTELAERRAVAAARQAAADAAAAAAAETERLALTAGTPEELSAALTSGIDNIAQFGPRGEFEVNGVVYPADPNRQGILTPRQVQNQATALSNSANELFLRADYERSDSPAEWARNFRDQVLDGNSPLSPGKSLSLLNSFEAAARADESRRRAEEKRVEREITDGLNAGLSPYLSAQENGLIVPVPEDVRTDLRAQAAGNPVLATQLEDQLAAADVIAGMQGLGPEERVAYIQGVQTRAIDDGIINTGEAEIINAMAPYLVAAKKQFTRETTGVTASEQALASGSILSDEALNEMVSAANASGNTKLIESAQVIAEAQEFLKTGQELTGVQREEFLNNIGATYEELMAEGEAKGADVQRQLRALDFAQKHIATPTRLAEKEPVIFAAKQGIALQPFPTQEEATLPEVADMIVARIGTAGEAFAQYGNDLPVPLSQSELEGISDWMKGTNNASRIGFIETLNASLTPEHSEAVLERLGVDNPELMAAGQVSRSNPAASRAILAGIGATVSGDTKTNRSVAELQIRPITSQGFLPPDEVERVGDIASMYARGIAAREGRSEATVADLERGYDIAMGADENGNGGIEDTGAYGVTVLPTGVKGGDVEDRLWRLGEDRWQELAGGAITDGSGRPISAERLFGTRFRSGAVTSLKPLGDGQFVPLDIEGGFFMTPNGPLTFTLEDIFDE